MVGFFSVQSSALASEGACNTGAVAHLVSALGKETNQMRANQGQARLQIDPRLSLAAQRHACDLARRQTVSHRDGMGRRPMSRIKNAGFRACFSAENVAQATATPGATLRAWQSSAGHASNQQDPRAQAMGFGVAKGADGHLYWVGVYAADCQSQMASNRSTKGLRPFEW